MRKFREFLSGRTAKFVINLIDGHRFIGRLKSSKRFEPAGDYYAKITFTDGKQLEGRFKFEPTPELPSTLEFLKFKYPNREIQLAQINPNTGRRRRSPADRKWQGVFLGK